MFHVSRFMLHGIVVPGKGAARQLGYPTANVRIKNYELGIRNGVYSAIVTVNNHQHMAAAIVGMWQEIEGPSLEVHLINFSGDLLGQKVTVELGQYLRPLKEFTNNEELVEQIKKDLKVIKPYHLQPKT